VACAAAPVNWDGVPVAERVPLAAGVETMVPVPTRLVTVAMAEEAGVIGAVYAAELGGAGVDASGVEEGAALEGGALEGAGVLEAPPGALRDRGTPASAQVPSTAVMTFAWSAAEHDDCTQGVTLGIRSVFLQWQAKSVRPEQPSVVRTVTKQLRAQEGMLSS